MFKSNNIALGFISIVLTVACLGLLSLMQLSKIADNMDRLYKHPFSVSNAAKDINFHLVSMHRYMKDVVLANDKNELEHAVNLVATHERAALNKFDIIFDRFLGEKSQISSAYSAFIDWQPIRKKVVSLVRAGNVNAASEITKTTGAAHVARLNVAIEGLVDFAYNKAQMLHIQAQENKRQAIYTSSVFTIVAVVLVVFFAFYVSRSLSNAKRDVMQRSKLIDQNIMMATLDRNLVVIEISNALCRFLGCTKEDVLGERTHFFDNSSQCKELEEKIINTVQTGKEWSGEIQHHDQNGKINWAASSVLPLYDENHDVYQYSYILTDITSKKLSGVDKLTSLLNRRRYDEILPQEIRLARRNGHQLTLAILDIDFFKNYNDCYGHPKGDLALQKVAKVMMVCLKRPNDFVFRIGGEEFAILFSHHDAEQSQFYLNEIRQRIQAQHIEHKESRIDRNLTVSIGAHVISSDSPLDEKEIYLHADKALYQAKEHRNKVVVTSAS